MPEGEGHSDCKCSQNMDFLGQILNGKNPLEKWIKNEVEKLLPDDLRNLARSLEVIEDTKNNKTTFTHVFPTFNQNLNVKGDCNTNMNIKQDYIFDVESNHRETSFKTNGHNNLDIHATGDINREYITPGEINFDMKCRTYQNKLMVDTTKYVMKEVEYKDGRKGYGYVLDDSKPDVESASTNASHVI
jgi:hypothetical protein